MGTKLLRCQNQELLYFDQVLKGEAVTLTNPTGIKFIKNQIVPQEGGLYSSKVGRLVDDNINLSEYSCSPTCNYLTGRVWEGHECPMCHQIVKNNYDVKFDHNGFIDIGEYRCMQPAAFSKIAQLLGKPTLDEIINFDNNLDLQGNLIIGNTVANKKNPYAHIGMIEFYNRFEEIIAYFGQKKKKQRDADFIIRMKNRVWTSKLNVLSQELRPAFINSSEKTMRYDKLNSIYAIIISNASLIAKARIMNQYMNINKYLYTIQTQMYELYLYIVSKLDGKMKLPRRNIQGTKMCWSSRLVITANIGDTYGIDHIVISYKAFLELYKYEIMNCLKRGIVSDEFVLWTWYELAEWFDVQRYSNVVQPTIYKTMKWLIDNTEEGLWCIVNRPPTMDLGSIQVLRVVDVINNAIENHMKVPLTSLVSWNGDFDGDTLSIYSLKEANIAKAFCDAFNPRRLINNKISGYKVYNQNFGLPKDLLMFIFPFVPEFSDSFSKGA